MIVFFEVFLGQFFEFLLKHRVLVISQVLQEFVDHHTFRDPGIVCVPVGGVDAQLLFQVVLGRIDVYLVFEGTRNVVLVLVFDARIKSSQLLEIGAHRFVCHGVVTLR